MRKFIKIKGRIINSDDISCVIKSFDESAVNFHMISSNDYFTLDFKSEQARDKTFRSIFAQLSDYKND